MPKIRVLIADDHAMLRSGLHRLVDAQAEMQTIGEAADGHDAIRMAQESEPDIVLLDIGMPGPRAIEVVRQIVSRRPKTRVLVVTMHDDPVLAREMLAAGASGYVVKMASEEELLSAIRAVHEGRTFVDVSLAGDARLEALPGGLDERAAPVTVLAPRLSRREHQVLEQLSQGFTNREIAERIAVSIKTVETYRHRLAEKLGLKRRSDVVRYALRAGILDAAKLSTEGHGASGGP